jgi:homoserine O-acetyltransferase
MDLVITRSASWHEPLRLDSGASLAPFTIAYEQYGELNAARDNAVLILHALSGDAHVAGRLSSEDRRPGWWDGLVGPGKPFDTERYCIICSNVLGGCKGSTGPSSTNPATGLPYGSDFPVLTIGDMVAAQARLLDRLEISTLLAAVGGSMGGFQALEWAARFPGRVRGVAPLAASARSTAQMLAWNAIMRRAIMSDPRWRGGHYYGHEPPTDGLAVARMIGHITYLSEPSLERKFGRSLQHGQRPAFTLGPEYAVESYLDYQGESFNARFDANTYLYILKAMDYFDLPGTHGSLETALGRADAGWLLMSFTSDWLYPTAETELIAAALRRAGRRVEHLVIESDLGHDAFLLEEDKVGPPLAAFLASCALQ